MSVKLAAKQIEYNLARYNYATCARREIPFGLYQY